jgi:hypothetical protein
MCNLLAVVVYSRLGIFILWGLVLIGLMLMLMVFYHSIRWVISKDITECGLRAKKIARWNTLTGVIWFTAFWMLIITLSHG